MVSSQWVWFSGFVYDWLMCGGIRSAKIVHLLPRAKLFGHKKCPLAKQCHAKGCDYLANGCRQWLFQAAVAQQGVDLRFASTELLEQGHGIFAVACFKNVVEERLG